MRTLLGVYLIGCLLYGLLISIAGFFEKKVPNSTVIRAMILTPLWPWVMILTINNLRRIKNDLETHDT